jgi:ribosomal protein L18E
MPLYRRIARRGFSNHRFRQDYHVVNLEQLQGKFSKGDLVSAATLKEKGVVSGQLPVKILAQGDVPKGLEFDVAKISGSAREKIEKAGGKILASASSEGAAPAAVAEKTKSGAAAGKGATAKKKTPGEGEDPVRAKGEEGELEGAEADEESSEENAAGADETGEKPADV